MGFHGNMGFHGAIVALEYADTIVTIVTICSKRARVSRACAACRARKTKVCYDVCPVLPIVKADITQCDGDHPKCSECTARESDCQYTETELTQTKRRRADVEELFELLRTLPEESAFDLLARIRAGADTRDLVETMQYGNLLVKFASASAGVSQDSQDHRRFSEDSSARESSANAKPGP
ncbi:hypothetical protein J1614_009282 [Plenodomus biglobosus]|nr:hypothetical protein J1614_009282 [Plenodomus biglobosus]